MKYFALLIMVVLVTASLGCNTAIQLLAGTATPTATATPPPTATPLPTATPSPTATPTPESLVALKPLTGEASAKAEDLLGAALDALDGLDSVHFSLEAEIGMESEGLTATFPFRFEGDYQAPDRMKGKMALSLGFIALEMEMINIGQESYVTDPQTGLWEKTDGNAIGDISPTQFTGLAGAVTSMALAVVGEETLEDGTEALHLLGISTEAAGVEGPALDLETNIYIGLDDSLIRQVRITGAIPLDPGAIAEIIPGLPIPLGGSEGNATISMITNLSAFNEPVEIEAPIP